MSGRFPSYLFAGLALLVLSTVACASGYGPARSADAQLAFGVDMAKRGLWDEALFRFRQAEKIDPSDPRIVNNLAVAYEATGRFEEALELYRRALRMSPNDRTLRRNYSRFIEFYQGLQPEGEDEETQEAAEADGSDAAAGSEGR